MVAEVVNVDMTHGIVGLLHECVRVYVCVCVCTCVYVCTVARNIFRKKHVA